MPRRLHSILCAALCLWLAGAAAPQAAAAQERQAQTPQQETPDKKARAVDNTPFPGPVTPRRANSRPKADNGEQPTQQEGQTRPRATAGKTIYGDIIIHR